MRAPLYLFAAAQIAIGLLLWLTPGWLGPANLVSLVLATALLGWMARAAAAEARR